MHLGIYVGGFSVRQGGGYSFVVDLLDGLAGSKALAGRQVTLICEASHANEWVDRFGTRWPIVSVAPVRGWRRLWLGVFYYSPLIRRLRTGPTQLERLAKRLQIDLLWFLGVGAVESPDIPYIATVWDLQHRLQPFFPEVSHGGEWDKREQFYNHFLRRATYCLTGTAAGKREVERFYQLEASRVRVVALPTPLDALNYRINNDRSASPEAPPTQRPFLLYPAQFWPHKNHISLVRTLVHLRKAHRLDFDLVFVGDDKGNLAHVREAVAVLGLEAHVHFLGFVAREHLLSLYQQAAALVYVTLFGPDNIPPLEAFALGCPVVASRLSGTEEQLGDAALLVDATRPEAIADAVSALVADPCLQLRLVEAGHVRARAWTAEHYLGCIDALIEEFSAIRCNWSGSRELLFTVLPAPTFSQGETIERY